MICKIEIPDELNNDLEGFNALAEIAAGSVELISRELLLTWSLI